MGQFQVSKQRQTGIFSAIKTRLHRNRLGELLVLSGALPAHELKPALAGARASGMTLGRYLIAEQKISAFAVRRALTEQFMLRVLTAAVTIFVSMACLTGKANAASIKDVPARIAVTDVVFSPATSFPKLFGSSEKRSTSLSAFTKWTDMFERFDTALNSSYGQQKMRDFMTQITAFKDLPMDDMVVRVNALLNRVAYVNDNVNYGKSDYWATPIEFLTSGGDCEDYAIAKYTALRMLGVPEERLRLAIVQDLQKNIPHAVLIVYTDNGAMILDNQIKQAIRADNVSHYKPIFSINRTAWWLHSKPDNTDVTVVASASR